MTAALDRARGAFERRSWASAYELFAAEQSLRADDLERLSIAAFLTGRDDDCIDALERAYHAHADPGDAARCAFWLGFALMLRGEMARAGGWLGRCAARADEAGDCVARGYLFIPRAMDAMESGDAARGATLGAEAVEVAQRFDDADLRALGMLVCGETAIAAGETARGLALLDEAMVAVTSGEIGPIPSGIVYCAVIESCMFAFDIRRAAEWTTALQRWCDAQPDLVPFRGQCLVHRSQVLQAHGQWTEAVAQAREASARLSHPVHPAVGVAYYQTAELHRLRGNFAEAERAYREAAQFGRDPAPGFALLRLAQGRVDRALAAIRRALGEPGNPLLRPALLAAAVEIMLAARDVDGARRAADELSSLAAANEAPLLDAIGAYARGSLHLANGDDRAALGELRHACEVWHALEMPYEVARARELLAAALRGLGDLDAADVELDAARVAFERLGAAPDLARISPSSATPLTAREREVLCMVSAGRTNREIATQLSISEHTVARHLQNIFTKLDVSSRAAATAYAYEHGLARGQNQPRA